MPTLTSNKCQELFKCRVGRSGAHVMGGRWERDEPGSAEIRERDRCLLLLIWKDGVGHIYNTKTEQTPRGVTVCVCWVSQQTQCKSAQLEHLPPVSTVQKYIYAKTAYVVNNRLLSIIFSDPFWAIVLSLSSDVWSKWRQDCHCRLLWNLADI